MLQRRRALVIAATLAVAAVGSWLWTRASRDVAGGGAASGARGPRLAPAMGTSWTDDDTTGATGAAEGVVVDAAGKPVDGARVALERARGRYQRGSASAPTGGGPQRRAEAATAQGGRFRIERLVPGDYAVVALLDARAPAHRSPLRSGPPRPRASSSPSDARGWC